jgi:hypothetical protein
MMTSQEVQGSYQGSLGSWWHWFRREVLCWTHPDTGFDLALDGYGNWLKAMARGPQFDGDGATASGYYQDRSRADLCEAISVAMTQGGAGLAQLMSIESQLVALYSDARIDRRQWSFQERFRRVATGNANVSYLVSAPPVAQPDAAPAPAEPQADNDQPRDAAAIADGAAGRSIALVPDTEAAL